MSRIPAASLPVERGLEAQPDWVRVCDAEFDYVYWTLRRCGANAVDAEDLAQEVFLAIWRRRATFQAGRPLRPWIAGISFRVLLEHRRRGKREVPGGLVDLTDDRPGVDEHLVAEQARALVLAALGRMPEKQRIALVMHELDGVAVRDIAEILSVPIFTLYSRLKTARRTFAKEVRRQQVVTSLARASATPQALLQGARKIAPAPAAARRRAMARLRATTPPVSLTPMPTAPSARWPAGLALAGALALPLAGAAFWRALTPTPTPAAVHGARGPISYWRFDDPVGSGAARDQVRRDNACVLRRLDPARAWRGGVRGGGLAFEGGGWLECAHAGAALAGLTNQMTVSAWVTRGRVLPAYHTLVARQKAQGRLDQFFFGFANGELLFASHDWRGRLTHPLPPDLPQWFHVAATRSPDGTVVLYAGGREIARGHSAPGRLEGGNNPLLIGSQRNDPDPERTEAHFDGALDELAIYDRALSPAEIAALAIATP